MTKLHLIDGTYELFRMFFGAPKTHTTNGVEVAATRAWLRSLWSFLNRDEVTHVAVAFDHVIESFRNDLFDGYKTGAGIDPALWHQSSLFEEATEALGVATWPMVEFEADDAIAAAAHRFKDDFDQVVICSPDKDMGQCVIRDQVVLWDRRRDTTYNEAGIHEKFGVAPASIPHLLGLVGDAADGIPGIPKWGMKSAGTVLDRYKMVQDIPADHEQWDIKVRGAKGLAESLEQHRQEVALYVELATLRLDVPLPQESKADLAPQTPDRTGLEALCQQIEDPRFLARLQDEPASRN